MLVVIAIIGILMSILLPSIKSGRDLAKSAVCMANLKTSGLGNQLYANEYDNWAVAQWQNATRYPRWSQIEPFRDFVGWNKPNVHSWHIPNEMACPVGVEKKLALGLGDTSDNGNAIKAFYSYEHVAIFGWKSYRGMKLTWLGEPSALGNAADIWISVRVDINSMDARHNNRANFLLFDGRVQSISRSSAISAHQSASPWVDSSGWDLTDYNQAFN